MGSVIPKRALNPAKRAKRARNKNRNEAVARDSWAPVKSATAQRNWERHNRPAEWDRETLHMARARELRTSIDPVKVKPGLKGGKRSQPRMCRDTAALLEARAGFYEVKLCE